MIIIYYNLYKLICFIITPLDEPGRVQIKVYRGPDIVENDESYAAHGFWVKQPSEDY